jgi:hypothetical protein
VRWYDREAARCAAIRCARAQTRLQYCCPRSHALHSRICAAQRPHCHNLQVSSGTAAPKERHFVDTGTRIGDDNKSVHRASRGRPQRLGTSTPGPSPFRHPADYDGGSIGGNFLAGMSAQLSGRGPRVSPDFCGSRQPSTGGDRNAKRVLYSFAHRALKRELAAIRFN